MDVWKWEMKMCCGMQIESLQTQLLECKQKGQTTDIAVRPKYPAAPHDEMLFDSVTLFARSKDDGKIEVSGTVNYWSSSKGYWHESAVIRTFDGIDACIDWLNNASAASEECAEILDEKC